MLAQTIPMASTTADHCDFCFATSQRLVSYPCRQFETRFIQRGEVVFIRTCLCCPSDFRPDPRDIVLVSHVSLDAWGACATCAKLLDQAALDRLGQRMIAALIGNDVPLMHQPLVARQILTTLRAFWRHRLPMN